jgi:hypothetical protein
MVELNILVVAGKIRTSVVFAARPWITLTYFTTEWDTTTEWSTSRVLTAVENLTQFNHQPCLQKRVKIQEIQSRKREGLYLLFLL